MCRSRLWLLYCVSTTIWKKPALARFESTKSTSRKLPPNGTAGLARSCVSGSSRVPPPPASTIANPRGAATAANPITPGGVRTRRYRWAGRCPAGSPGPEGFRATHTMTRTVRLRPWQKAALDQFVESPKSDFLAVATPGAGKTTFALTAARHQLAREPGRLVVVAPTAHLKLQWARAAAAFSLHLDPAWSAADGALPGDMHGVVTSYQQVASSAGALARLARGALVVLDELHHAADDRAWGAAILEAFASARR